MNNFQGPDTNSEAYKAAVAKSKREMEEHIRKGEQLKENSEIVAKQIDELRKKDKEDLRKCRDARRINSVASGGAPEPGISCEERFAARTY